MDQALLTRLGLHVGVLAVVTAIVASSGPRSRPGPVPGSATPPPVATVVAAPTAPMTSPPAQSAVEVEASSPLYGTLLDDEISSPTIGRSLQYRIYPPPEYASGTRRYPVVYMLHGIGGNYTEWSDSFLSERTDELIAHREIPPLIVVMPDSGGPTYWANWSDGGPHWADYVAYDVVQTIDQRYRTLAIPESRAIGGLWMGGLGALSIALQHPDVFGVVGGHSPSLRLEPDPALWFLAGDSFDQHSPLRLAEMRTDVQQAEDRS